MKAQDDFSLSRDSRLALVIFLYSEKLRHEDDIVFIEEIISILRSEEKVTDKEWKSIVEMAERYRKF